MAISQTFTPSGYAQVSANDASQSVTVPAGATAALIANLGPDSIAVAEAAAVTAETGLVIPPSQQSPFLAVTAGSKISVITLGNLPSNSQVYITFGS